MACAHLAIRQDFDSRSFDQALIRGDQHQVKTPSRSQPETGRPDRGAKIA